MGNGHGNGHDGNGHGTGVTGEPERAAVTSGEGGKTLLGHDDPENPDGH